MKGEGREGKKRRGEGREGKEEKEGSKNEKWENSQICVKITNRS